MTTYNATESIRLIACARSRYASTGTVLTPDALDMADQLEAARDLISLLDGTMDAEIFKLFNAGSHAEASDLIRKRDATRESYGRMKQIRGSGGR